MAIQVKGDPTGGLITERVIPASVCELTYPIRNALANSEAFDKHEQLMKEGWECLKAPRKEGENLVICYLKLNDQ